MSPRPVPAKFRVADPLGADATPATNGLREHRRMSRPPSMALCVRVALADQRSDDLLFAILRRSRGVVNGT